MLAFEWVGKIDLEPMVYAVKNPVVDSIWKVPHVNEVNLGIECVLHLITMMYWITCCLIIHV